MTALITRLATAAGVLALASACTMKDQEAPPLTGPSEFSQSISITVSPDVLPQDGASQSFITVTARDANAQPIRNLTLRTETRVGGVPVDFGTHIGAQRRHGERRQGHAGLHRAGFAAVSPDAFLLVDIVVTPLGTDFNNSSQRTASIRLVPQGGVIPPGDLVPAFTFTPSAPRANQTVLFDASTSKGSIADYPGTSAMATMALVERQAHDYGSAGTYIARLTISMPSAEVRRLSQSITVGAGVAPTAAFVFSPTNPLPIQQIFFNASASRPAPGRTLTAYRWDFGDGASGTGVQPSHSYALAGSYNVTLVVTDDAGRTATVTSGLTVLSDNPIALFTFTPTAPTVGAAIAFNASTSTAAPGRTITGYSWNFGDGTTGSGVAPSKTYTTAGTRNVTLTVTDNTGKSGSTTVAVTVQ